MATLPGFAVFSDLTLNFYQKTDRFFLLGQLPVG